MDLRRALKEDKVPTETVLLGREFQWSMTREKKDNFEEFKRTGGLQSMKRWPRVTLIPQFFSGFALNSRSVRARPRLGLRPRFSAPSIRASPSTFVLGILVWPPKINSWIHQ